jgi:hypothetical protein
MNCARIDNPVCRRQRIYLSLVNMAGNICIPASNLSVYSETNLNVLLMTCIFAYYPFKYEGFWH